MSIEDALRHQGQVVRREMAAWDVNNFVDRLGERIAAEGDSGGTPVAPVVGRQRDAARPAGRRDRRPPRSGQPPALTDEEELLRLCEDAVTVPEVEPLLEGFVTGFDPSGARVFACLLYLADQAEHAQFWWRFACGGEDGLAAYCLTLHSRATGTPRDIQTWATYTHTLHFDPEQHWPQPDRTHSPDTRRLSDCVQAHLRTEDEDAAIPLPTADLPRELVAL